MRDLRLLLQSLVLWLLCLSAAQAFDPEHAAWTRLLQAHVQWNAEGTASAVDYAGFALDKQALGTYLEQLAEVDLKTFETWNEAERQAFLINAYNAHTIALILTAWPEVESIKDLGDFWTSPWKLRNSRLLGETRSLDEIEHTLLRGAPGFLEPRVHFAVNCASIGCPALRPEAYVGARLDEQLEDQTQRFLRDRSRNLYDRGTEAMSVSRIFDWYEDDFERGWRGAQSVAQFLALYAEALALDGKTLERLRAGEIDIDYQRYDWSLNRTR